ncbi:MAG: spinster family MFS transporter [Gemmatimonas sp.]|uniref:spinster family MFS transporter n=1 Tax=Gemmatimonas sp. TaxID=1962908 RepID=UPI00391F0830
MTVHSSTRDGARDPLAAAAGSRASAGDAGGLRPVHAWGTVAILTLANVFGFLDRIILSYLVKPLRRDFALTDTEVSLLMGLSFTIFYSLLGLPIGRWVDRGSRPRIIALGVAVWSLLTAVTGFARSFAQLFAARIGVGVGEATLGPAAVSLIADTFPRRGLAIAMSVYQMGSFTGAGLAYAVGAFAVGRLDVPGRLVLPWGAEIYPWQTVFFWVGLPGLLVALLALFIREPRREAASAQAREVPVPVREVLRYMRANGRTIGALSFGFACSLSVNLGVASWLPTFLDRTHGWTIAQAGLLQGALTFFIGPIGVLAGGRLTDAWGKRGMVDAPLRVGMVGALGMLVCAGIYPLVPAVPVVVALLVAVNVFAALPWGAASAAVAEAMPPRMRGQGSAVYQLIVNLVAGVLGPTAVALLTDRVFGDPQAIRYSLSVLAVAAMSCTLLLLGWARPAYVRTVQAMRDAG